MDRPLRFTQEMVDEYVAKGHWTEETTSHLWEKNSELYPHKEALVSSQRRLTWSHLKQISDRLAWGFLELGLKKGELLLLLVPNCCESYLIRVACEKAGILCSTALMTLRENEIEYILRTFDAAAVAIPWKFRSFDYYTAIQDMHPRLPGLKYIFTIGDEVPTETISIEELMQAPLEKKHQGENFRNTEITATEVSVIACTSGTTGLPKGVEHAQCTRMAAARNYGSAVKLTGEDVVLNIVSGIAGLGAAFCYNGSAPLVGAKSVLLEIWSPEKTFQRIEKEKATVLVAVPAQIAQIIKDPGLNRYDIRSLRCITTGTAPLPSRLATEAEETLKIPISNCYGQLDGGVVTHTTVDDPPEVRRKTVGKPAKGMVIKLIDEEGKEASEGEVVYSGPATNGGYYKDLDSTLKAWGSLGLEGFFRSGDLGQFDPSGNLMLIGRKKDVIIRGGQNIYPTEIEGLLLSHRKIRSVALVSMPDPIMGEKVCAYVALNPGEGLTLEEMISFLKEKKIASYKLPERLEVLNELPLRGHQKVAKRELQKDLIQKLEAERKL
jgi:non-ribosomal peptide synthetase component E (peptide arylation enzyme)